MASTRSGIDTYIIKTVEWCNLNCTYCYFYHGQDTSFEARPRFLPRAAVDALVPKIIDHSRRHGVRTVHLTLHGGEPLLQKKDDFVWTMERFDEIDAAGIKTLRKVTTNGVLLDDEWAELLTRYRLKVGVSIDGPRELHDSARVDFASRGSYDRAVRGLQTALRWQHSHGLHVGTITVLNPSLGGGETYRHLRSLGVRILNILLPEANYVTPLPVQERDGSSYGTLLTEFFDAWVEEGDPTVKVRLLSDVVKAVAGQPAISDQFGYAPVRVAVLETDGSLQPTDNFRACADGMSELGVNVYRDRIDDLYYNDFFRLCIDVAAFVPDECSGCRFVDICGGGRITTRYSVEDGFSRKTVHCDALYSLFTHVDRVLRDGDLLPT